MASLGGGEVECLAAAALPEPCLGSACGGSAVHSQVFSLSLSRPLSPSLTLSHSIAVSSHVQNLLGHF